MEHSIDPAFRSERQVVAQEKRVTSTGHTMRQAAGAAAWGGVEQEQGAQAAGSMTHESIWLRMGHSCGFQEEGAKLGSQPQSKNCFGGVGRL
eukprot:scaffold138434_cov18-Tisochrysis_lutea.AAC.1